MGKGRAAGRVGSDFLSAIAGRVGSTFRWVGSGRFQKSDPWTTLLSTAMQNSKLFLGTISRTPVLGERKACFRFPERVSILSYSNAEFQNKSGGRTPGTRFFWRGRGESCRLLKLCLAMPLGTSKQYSYLAPFIPTAIRNY